MEAIRAVIVRGDAFEVASLNVLSVGDENHPAFEPMKLWDQFAFKEFEQILEAKGVALIDPQWRNYLEYS